MYVCLSIYLSIYPSIYLSIYLLIYLSNEWEAVESLKENDFVVIQKAVEGGVVVIMNNSHY